MAHTTFNVDAPSRRSKNIIPEKALETINKECSSALIKYKEKKQIFRGVKSTAHNFLYIKPNETYRYARNTNNFTNVLIDCLPSWKDWPKRSRSIICSTHTEGSGGYGKVFNVFPYNNAKIGICSFDDFWGSFPYLSSRMQTDADIFNSGIDFIINHAFKIGIDLRRIREPEFNKLIQFLNEKYSNKEKWLPDVRQKYKDIMFISVVDMLLDIEKNHNGDWLEYFDTLFNPIKNEFILTTIEDYQVESETNESEVWTDSESILIDSRYCKEYLLV